MREHRFHIDPVANEATDIVLTGAEAHHLRHVLRLSVGDEVLLFDGTDHEYSATITRAGKHEMDLRIDERRFRSVEAARPVVIASAVPKGDRQQWLIEKLVELGVAGWIPVGWSHSAVRAEAKSRERWQRYVIEASKQCRRNRLMMIGPTIDGAQLLAQPSDCWQACGGRIEQPQFVAEFDRWLLDPSGQAAVDDSVDSRRGMLVAIGPEGGFAAGELEAAAAAQWGIVSWGARIMRLETAALAVAATLLRPR